jgi:hypothetical protein
VADSNGIADVAAKTIGIRRGGHIAGALCKRFHRGVGQLAGPHFIACRPHTGGRCPHLRPSSAGHEVLVAHVWARNLGSVVNGNDLRVGCGGAWINRIRRLVERSTEAFPNVLHCSA